MALPATTTAIDTRRIEKLYVLADRQEVVAFLADHPFLIPLLEAAREPLDSHFGSEIVIRLEVMLDPETEVDRTLIAWAETGHLSPDESLARLGAFWDDWRPESPPGWWEHLRFDIE
jgi:hypothetical protein